MIFVFVGKHCSFASPYSFHALPIPKLLRYVNISSCVSNHSRGKPWPLLPTSLCVLVVSAQQKGEELLLPSSLLSLELLSPLLRPPHKVECAPNSGLYHLLTSLVKPGRDVHQGRGGAAEGLEAEFHVELRFSAEARSNKVVRDIPGAVVVLGCDQLLDVLAVHPRGVDEVEELEVVHVARGAHGLLEGDGRPDDGLSDEFDQVEIVIWARKDLEDIGKLVRDGPRCIHTGPYGVDTIVLRNVVQDLFPQESPNDSPDDVVVGIVAQEVREIRIAFEPAGKSGCNPVVSSFVEYLLRTRSCGIGKASPQILRYGIDDGVKLEVSVLKLFHGPFFVNSGGNIAHRDRTHNLRQFRNRLAWLDESCSSSQVKHASLKPSALLLHPKDLWCNLRRNLQRGMQVFCNFLESFNDVLVAGRISQCGEWSCGGCCFRSQLRLRLRHLFWRWGLGPTQSCVTLGLLLDRSIDNVLTVSVIHDVSRLETLVEYYVKPRDMTPVDLLSFFEVCMLSKTEEQGE
ncbi:hypothetical protein GGR53DRAFT_159771 [Hypoxylon sp. FL1150]|nr:hypothetical protein GGR53DRAFT_159771 [Hypoxylon sp. FL1150]